MHRLHTMISCNNSIDLDKLFDLSLCLNDPLGERMTCRCTRNLTTSLRFCYPDTKSEILDVWWVCLTHPFHLCCIKRKTKKDLPYRGEAYLTLNSYCNY
ncbi:uncharacterized protein LOC114342777 isoform X1 [Diabrotica virgifera virgifera]|uniref:Uncharacterized protein n=2 Tax=Diabrotica virgifera virgifera TaxID=50390 RepID=A0ABM5IYF9_DIAVI|nr:uncharacterized protein LOC114342777 isoform X1 [Diabrotica virgifera virgifera]